MPEIDYGVDRALAVISFGNPPVNGLSHAVRAGIADGLAPLLERLAASGGSFGRSQDLPLRSRLS